jgi:hypothetical protein
MIARFPLIVSFFMAGALLECSPVPAVTIKLLHQDPSFGPEQLSGQTILILPLLTKTGFDTTQFLLPQHQGSWLTRRRSDLEPVYRDKFEAAYKAAHDSVSLVKFYRALYKGNMIPLHNADSIWKAMPAAYLLAMYLRSGMEVRNLYGRTHRSVSLEAELWQIDSTEVVWRLSATESTADATMSDAAFIWNAITHIYAQFPEYRPSINETKW